MDNYINLSIPYSFSVFLVQTLLLPFQRSQIYFGHRIHDVSTLLKFGTVCFGHKIHDVSTLLKFGTM